MTEAGHDSDDMQAVAVRAVTESLHTLLADPENADLRDVISEGQFAERLVAIAWMHQFDIEMARFRRELKTYIADLSTVASGES